MAQSFWLAELWNLPDDGTLPTQAPDRLADATGVEETIAHSWGVEQPSIGGQLQANIAGDRFFVRWSRRVRLTGVQTFRVTADDGLRISIYDDEDLVWHSPDELWGVHGPTQRRWTTPRLDDFYNVEIEYFEHGGEATAIVNWACTLACADGWTAEYFDRWNLSNGNHGTDPIATRIESRIWNDWGHDGPVLPAWESQHNFSARWTRTYFVEPATYTFEVAADDGVRLFANGDLVIDQWRDTPLAHYQGDYQHLGGALTLVLEYYESGGEAVVHFRPPWEEPDPVYPQWKAEYWGNDEFSGAPALVRNEATIDHQYGHGWPGGYEHSEFSARYQRDLFTDEVPRRYRFELIAEGNAELRIRGRQVVAIASDGGDRVVRTADEIVSGLTPLRVDFNQESGSAKVGLSWELAGDTTGDLVICDPPGDIDVTVFRTNDGNSSSRVTDTTANDKISLSETGGIKYIGLPIDYEKYGEYGHPYRIEYHQGHTRRQEYEHYVYLRGDVTEVCAERVPPGCEWLLERPSCAR